MNRDQSNHQYNIHRYLYHTILTAEPEINGPDPEKIENIIQSLKNNKAPGEDNINSELIKIGGDQLITQIHRLIQRIWTNEQIPKDWNLEIVCSIFKT